MKAYHISPFKFDKFELRPDTGMGTNFYGYGIYFTRDESVIDYYAEIMKEASYEKLYKYTVELDSTGFVSEFADNGLTHYADLVEMYDSEKVASEEMLAEGITGIYYANQEDGNSIIVYDLNTIKIVSRELI